MSRTGGYIGTKSRVGLIMIGGWCGDRWWELKTIEFLVWWDKKCSIINCGDGCTYMWIGWNPPNCTLTILTMDEL